MNLVSSLSNFVLDHLSSLVNLPLDILGRLINLPFGLSNNLVLDLVKVSGKLLNYIDFETLLNIAEGSINGHLNLIDLLGNQISTIAFNELINLLQDTPTNLRTISSLNLEEIIVLPTLFEGKDGHDYLVGTDTGNIINGQAGHDELQGRQGSDVIYGGTGNDTLLGQKGFDILNGEDGDDWLDGARGDDLLTGGFGRDTLVGFTGNDILNGGADNDILTGGVERDYFIFGTGTEFANNLSNNLDEITDFSSVEQDKIILDPKIFNTLVSVVGNGFSVISEFAIVDREELVANSIAKIVYNSSTGGLYYNVNGNQSGFGTGGQFATLTNRPNLSANDLIIANDSVTMLKGIA